MPIEFLPGQKKIYFTTLDINPFLMQEAGCKKENIKFILKEILNEKYVIEADSLNRKFKPTLGFWYGDIHDFYLKSINKNTIPEYIPCPSFLLNNFRPSYEDEQKWKNNPVLKPCEAGMLFLLELKPPVYPPDLEFIDGLAGAGGRL